MTFRRHLGFAALTLTMLTVASPAAPQPMDGAAIQNAYADSLVYLEGQATFPDGSSDKWTGTGFIVHDKGYVITAAHVAGDPTQYRRNSIKLLGAVRSKVLPKLPVEVVDLDSSLDLALLKLPYTGTPFRPVRIGDSNSIASAQSIFVFGFPRDRDLSFSPGAIAGLNAEKGRFQVSAALNEGDSGGPVFDNQGSVVSVVVGGIKSAQSISFVIPINYARGLLRLVGPPW